MGWSDCGTDSTGRPIGYAHAATCDHPGCGAKIDRGLSYVCGEMHGSDEYSCDKYFCEDHKANYVGDEHTNTSVCDQCAKALIGSGDWEENEDGEIVRKPACSQGGDV